MLAIDGGNSKTDVALVAGDGTLLASARGPGINAHEVGVDQTVLILDAVVKQAAAYEDNMVAWPSVEPADDYTANSLLAFALGADQGSCLG